MGHYYDKIPDLHHHQQWIDYELSPHRLKLMTDAGVFSKNGVDFGSRVLVKTFLETSEATECHSILELGAGYGPLILMLAKHLPQAQCQGIEINERAYLLAQLNAETNQLERVKFHLGDASEVKLDQRVTHVVTNPPIRAGKNVVQNFVQVAFDNLVRGGQLYVVIQKKQGAPSMQKFMESVFNNVEKITQDKGYWILKSVKEARD